MYCLLSVDTREYKTEVITSADADWKNAEFQFPISPTTQGALAILPFSFPLCCFATVQWFVSCLLLSLCTAEKMANCLVLRVCLCERAGLVIRLLYPRVLKPHKNAAFLALPMTTLQAATGLTDRIACPSACEIILRQYSQR